MTTVSMYRRPGGFSSGRLGPLERAKRVFEYRRILKLLVQRDLKVRYAGSALGYLWTVLDPLLMSLVYWFIVTKIFNRNVPGENPYILFVVSGQLMWHWFNGGVTGTARALRSEAQMVRSSNVPRELWVLRVIISKFVEYIFSLPVLALFALGYLKEPNWRIIFLPVAWGFMFLLITGVGLILAPITVLVRDTDRLVPIFMRMMFYLCPVLYSVESITKRAPELAKVYSVNPVVGPMSLARCTFFPQEFRIGYIWHSLVATLVILAIGVWTFMRLERQMLKEV